MTNIIVKEIPEIWKYIFSRNLDKQYRKVKGLLKDWNFRNIDFKLRQPKRLKVYQFKINNKYRWYWIFRETEMFWKIFLVTEISDHQ
jgi:hypothetical protein